MNKPQNYLIIQGPIISYGLTGRGWVEHTTQNVPEKKNFSCFKNINRIIEENKTSEFQIVVSVFAKKNEIELLSNSNNSKIIMNDYKKIESLIGNRYTLNKAKYCQFFLILEALENINAKDIDNVVKIRSDMYFSKNSLDMLFKSLKKKPDYFHIPYFLKNRLLSIPDFYICANFKRFKHLAKLLCYDDIKNTDRNVHHSISTELYFNQFKTKELYFDYKNLNEKRSIFSRTKLHLKILNYISQNFVSLPKIIWQNSKLRGRSFVSPNKTANKNLENNIIFLENSHNFFSNITRGIFFIETILVGGQYHAPNKKIKFFFSKRFLLMFRSAIYRRILAFINFYLNYKF